MTINAAWRRVRDWVGSSLRRELLIAMALAGIVAALLLLTFFVVFYQRELASERAEASTQLNLLLQAALENAMLKRDVPGLQQMVARLGQQPAVRDVMILNPGGQVRFASNSARLGELRPELAAIALNRSTVSSELVELSDQVSVVRSINPVHNKAQCSGCHGLPSAHPINGVLVIDYAAEAVRDKVKVSITWMAAAASATLLLLSAVGYGAVRRLVLAPVAHFMQTSALLGLGNLGARVSLRGRDEFSRLADVYNGMAESMMRSMRASESQRSLLQQVLDGLPDGVRVIDANYRLVLANEAYYRQHSRSSREGLSRHCYESSHGRTQPCVSTMVVCPLQELKHSGSKLKFNHAHVRQDGASMPVEVNAAVIEVEDVDARQTWLVESIREIANVSAVSQEERLSEIGLLAAGVGHEIHNPLASARLAVQNLLRNLDVGQNDPLVLSEYLRLIDDQIDKCIVITQRLLLLTRHPEIEEVPVDVNTAVTDTVQLLHYEAVQRDIRQQTTLDACSPLVKCDRSELRMLMLNLVQNAYHAMPKGGQVLISTRVVEKDVEIVVADHGVGIPPDVLPHIFEPFFSRRADGQIGTGLGLTICRSIVERYRGTIAVQSKVDSGTVFTIKFALHSATTS